MKKRWRQIKWPFWVGVTAVVLFLVLVGRFWHPVFGFTSFLQFNAEPTKPGITHFQKFPVFSYQDTGGYDGQYYAQIAYDLTLRSPELPGAIDNLSYRARRILPSFLAWTLAGGRPEWIVHVYSVLNIVCWLIFAALAWRLLAVSDLRSWLAWAGLLFSAGCLHSVRLALTDLIATTLIAAAMFAQERNQRRLSPWGFAAASLSKETAVLSLGGLIRGAWNDKHTWARFAIAVAVAIVPLGLWLLYIRHAVGAADQGWSNFAVPLSGLFVKWRESLNGLAHTNDPALAWSTWLAVVGVTVQSLWLATRPQVRAPWWWLGAPYVALTAFLGTAVWEGHPGAFTRVLLPLQLAFNILAVRHRAWIVVIVAGNVGLFSGLLTLCNTRVNPAEFGAGRSGSHAVVARAGSGWFPTEATWSQTRTWSSGDARMLIEHWPRDAEHAVRVEFSIRAFTPRLLQIRQRGKILWEGHLGRDRQRVRIDGINLTKGVSELEFITDQPASPESDSPGARRLAFALYNLTIEPSD
jgi:hypothetical protein